MNYDWTAEVVGRMHGAGISGLQLAEECGVSNSYLSTVLHGKKGTEKTLEDAVEMAKKWVDENKL